jgi:LacI family transcriptional regulator
MAGVSLSTASLVLSGKGAISDEVQVRVRSAAASLGYRKFQPLRVGKEKKAAVLFHFDHFLAHTWNMLRQVTLELQAHLEKNNYLTVLIPITYDMSDDTIFNKVVASEAVVVFSMHFGRETLFSRLEDISIPVVVIINSSFQTKFHTVCADNFQGSYEAASHLISLGHRNIVYAEFDIYQLPSTLSDRFLGFVKAMHEYGLDFPDRNRLHLDINDIGGIENQFREVFSGDSPPSAVFFIDDYLAAHCHGILRKLGLSWPGEIGVIAAGEILDYNEPYIPAITTMHTSPRLLGKFSAEMSLNILENEQQSNLVLKIKQDLVDRGTCRHPGGEHEGRQPRIY